MNNKIIKASLLALSLAFLNGCNEGHELMKIREQMSTVDLKVDGEGIKPELIYSESINSQTMYCGARVNGMEQLTNLGIDSGTFNAGFNPTAFLEEGVNNLELWTAPIGVYEKDYTYHEDDNCKINFVAAFKDGKITELTSLTANIEEGKPTVKHSKIYPDNHQTSLINPNGEVRHLLTVFERPVYIKTVPHWHWVDATPIREDNPEQMKKLHKAYDNLIALMKARDFEGLKMAYSISSREKAKAEAYFSEPDDYYKTVGFEMSFDSWEDSVVEPRRAWSEYRFKSFAGGRLVRLADLRNHSPLRISSEKEDRMNSQLPYFSMIDGRVVISR